MKMKYYLFYHVVVLQQHLPFTVLKHDAEIDMICKYMPLQQHLPFTVLKLVFTIEWVSYFRYSVATALTVYGIETCNR